MVCGIVHLPLAWARTRRLVEHATGPRLPHVRDAAQIDQAPVRTICRKAIVALPAPPEGVPPLAPLSPADARQMPEGAQALRLACPCHVSVSP
jgi:hypothetical protein